MGGSSGETGTACLSQVFLTSNVFCSAKRNCCPMAAFLSSVGGKKQVRNIPLCLQQLGFLLFCYFTYLLRVLETPNSWPQTSSWSGSWLFGTSSKKLCFSVVRWQSSWPEKCPQFRCKGVIIHHAPAMIPGYRSAAARPGKSGIKSFTSTAPHLRCHRICKERVEAASKNN